MPFSGVIARLPCNSDLEYVSLFSDELAVCMSTHRHPADLGCSKYGGSAVMYCSICLTLLIVVGRSGRVT